MSSPEVIAFARALAVTHEQWKPLTAPTRNTADARSPAALRAIAAQFQVESANRYAPQVRIDPQTGKKSLTTFCNIYAWDVTRALDAELPLWVDAAKNPSGVGKANSELNCNALLPWLEQHGARHGWREVKTEVEAAMHAAQGRPAVAIWKNKAGPGHIAVLLPSSDTTTRIAQAGARCFFDRPLSDFGVAVRHLRFFTHP